MYLYLKKHAFHSGVYPPRKLSCECWFPKYDDFYDGWEPVNIVCTLPWRTVRCLHIFNTNENILIYQTRCLVCQLDLQYISIDAGMQRRNSLFAVYPNVAIVILSRFVEYKNVFLKAYGL